MNNLLQEQRSPQAPLLVTQLVRCGSRKLQNNCQEAKYHCSKDTLFSLSIYLFSFDDSIINYRSSSVFIPRATSHSASFVPISKRLRALNRRCYRYDTMKETCQANYPDFLRQGDSSLVEPTATIEPRVPVERKKRNDEIRSPLEERS